MDTSLSLPLSSCEYFENAHGNQVWRRVEVYDTQAPMPQGWNHIERLIKVRRWGNRGQRPFEEISYFVLSKPINSAFVVAKAVQGHWAIENKLHWIKDVIMGEDDMTLRGKSLVTTVVFLNNAALNIMQAADYKPNKNNFSKLANRVDKLSKLFEVHNPS